MSRERNPEIRPNRELPLFAEQSFAKFEQQAIACKAESSQPCKEVPMRDEPLVGALITPLSPERQAEKRPKQNQEYRANFLIKKPAPISDRRGGGEIRRSSADKAHARRNDPPHSHAAAKSVVNLGPVRDGILWLLELHGPLTDEQIADRWHPAFPEVSPSGLRSRRSELVRMGFVEAAGEGKTLSKRACTIWRLRK